MGDILEISASSHRNELCQGIGRLLYSEDDVGNDFEFFCDDSTPIKAHFFVLQIFCRALQNSNCRRICFESAEIRKEDVRCLLEFIYRGKTRVDVERLDAVKRAALKLRLETFLDLVEGIKVESVEVEVDVENVTDIEEELVESLAEDEDTLKRRQRSIHSKKCRHTCKTCGKCFRFAHHLRQHKLIHQEKVVCEICGRKISMRFIQEHHKLHEAGGKAKILKCPICAYRSGYGSNLKVHLKSIHDMSKEEIAQLMKSQGVRITDENPPQPMNDSGIIRRSFKTRKPQVAKVKNPPTKWSCEVCGVVLSGAYTLFRHRRLHKEGESVSCRFKCGECAFKTREGNNLKTHCINKHGMSKEQFNLMFGTVSNDLVANVTGTRTEITKEIHCIS